jgi:hypothetical protein
MPPQRPHAEPMPQLSGHLANTYIHTSQYIRLALLSKLCYYLVMRYLTCAETAKLIRAHLAREFPGTKFSVKSKTYSMGASISVRWTGGPSSKRVSAITSNYEGSHFDGMIDMASTHGTEGSRGFIPAATASAPVEGAEKVSPGADYVQVAREPAADEMHWTWQPEMHSSRTACETWMQAANVTDDARQANCPECLAEYARIMNDGMMVA